MDTNFKMENKYITMIKGDTFSIGIKCVDEKEQPIENISAVTMTCRDSENNKIIFQKSIGDGVEKSSEDSNTYIIRVAPSDTETTEAGKYVYDVEIKTNGDVFTILKGNLQIDDDITKAGIGGREYKYNFISIKGEKGDSGDNATPAEKTSSGLLLNTSYNFMNMKIGDTFSRTTSEVTGNATQTITLESDCIYYISGVGNDLAYKLYIIVDKNMKILAIKTDAINSRNTRLHITIPKNADKLLINYIGYNADTDGLYEKRVITKKALSGKSIVCFGDSITQFQDVNNKTYCDYITDFTGANVYNIGIGGTRLAVRGTPSTSPTDAVSAYAGLDTAYLIKSVIDGNYDIPTACATWIKINAPTMYDNTEKINTLKNIDWSTVDAITVFSGTNDWFTAKSLGNTNDSEFNTTLGAINYIIEEFSKKYPSIKIYWFTPIVRWIASNISERTAATWASNYKTSENKTLEDYASAIFSIVKDNYIPVCDMYHTLGFNMYNFSNYFLDTDGTHPVKGMEEVGKKISSFLISNQTF